MKIKTNDLTGHALDWTVAKCEYTDRRVEVHEMGGVRVERQPGSGDVYYVGWFNFRGSTDWAQGGPIIERENLLVGPSAGHRPVGVQWTALRMGVLMPDTHRSVGPTLLTAAMRCFVASRLGDEVDVPEELTRSSATVIPAPGLSV